MRTTTMLREAIATAWAAKVHSLLSVVVVAAMCLASLLTVGRAASNAAAVAAQMESSGARKLSVIDARGQGFINMRTLEQVRAVSTVESAVALGVAVDCTNGAVGPGGTKVAAWPVLGDITTVGTLVRGRLPQEGEALVTPQSLTALGLAEPVGYLTTAGGRQFPVVGVMRPSAPYSDLAQGAVVQASPQAAARELRVVIRDVAAVRATVTATLGLLGPREMQGVYVESPTGIADTAQELARQLAGFGQGLLGMILAAGGFFVAAVVLTDVLIRRRDLGRRRTLGASRADLLGLVTTRTALTAAVGAVLGCAIGWFVNHRGGHDTPLAFTVAVGVLAVVVAWASALPPAVFAARRDPVSVLRTP